MPEILPGSSTAFHEREDHGHILKRIAQCTRVGGPREVRLERWAEALKVPSTKLTLSALQGEHLQDVGDAERLFSPGLLLWLEENKYEEEAKYVRIVLEWHKAHDVRGLSQLQRCKANHEMMNYILDEWMPWHQHTYDFSLLEVNHPVIGVRGFTREVLVALLANIESEEQVRCEQENNQESHEHPRASQTDDVECLFSIFRDVVGKAFDVREVQLQWRKICSEFAKRLDPNLPFHYLTSSHHRFHIGDLPSFDDPMNKPSRLERMRPPRRDLTSIFVSGRATMPVRGSLTVRARYHKRPTDLPPTALLTALPKTMPSLDLLPTATSSDSLQTVTSDMPQRATLTDTLQTATSTDSPPPDSPPTVTSSDSLQTGTSDLPQTAVPSNLRVAALTED